MPHDFEKNYPLPFRAHVFQEKLLKKPKTLMVYARNGYYIFSSRIENRIDVFKYMVSCANLMPEAELSLCRARAALHCVCMECQQSKTCCSDCVVRAANESAKRCLAKLEGSGI